MSKEKQTIHGEVGNVVSGDVTIHNYTAEASSPTQQPISLLQKRDLHKLMDEFVDAGESKRELWLLLHTRLDTTTVNEMTSADYHLAVEILQDLAQRNKYSKDCNALISKIISLTDPTHRVDRDRYCLKHFGTTHLKGLDKEQLQGVFGYFDDLLVVANEAKTAPSLQNTAPQIVEPTPTKNKKLNIILGAVIFVIAAALFGAMHFFNNSSIAKETPPDKTSAFTVDTSDDVINASLTALRNAFPGLDKYSRDLLSVSTYKQKSGWHTLKFTVSPQTSAPESYRVGGKTCYINIHPEGDYARVATDPCQSLVLDQQDTPHNKYRFMLR